MLTLQILLKYSNIHYYIHWIHANKTSNSKMNLSEHIWKITDGVDEGVLGLIRLICQDTVCL